MSYIEKQLLAGEQIVFKTKKHKIIFFYPVLLTLFLLLYGSPYMRANEILQSVEWIPWFVALILWAYMGILYMASEFVVTNKRVIMREGFFNKHVIELRISAVSQVNVEQGIIAQLLNYGRVSLNSFGAFDSFDMLAKPEIFQREINRQLDKLSRA
jgi:uncharacterized membrane protein YdbT with pleckstrin-like domain